MDIVSSHWFPTAVELSDEIQRLVNTRFDIGEETFEEIFCAGSWWVIPFARTFEGKPIGLRLTPKLKPADSPVLVANESNALTVSTRPATYLPARVFRTMTTPGRWKTVAELKDAGWKELGKLHHALGGTDEGLEALRKLAADEKARDAQLDAKLAVNIRATLDGLDRLDPYPEAKTARAYCRSARFEKKAPFPLPEAGVWDSWVATLAFVLHRDEENREGELTASWAVVRQPPGLDSEMERPEPVATLGGGWSEENGIAVAKTIIRRKTPPQEWKSDLLWPAIEALAKSAKKYDGAAHAAAAAALEKAGQPEAAYTALIAASFWSYNASGTRSKVRGDLLDQALQLAKRSGWSHFVDAFNALIKEREHVNA